MLEIGEIVGLLETKILDKTKKVVCTNTEHGIRMDITSANFDKKSDTMVISNNKNCDVKTVSSLIFDLLSYQSTEKVEFLFYNKDGEFIRRKISTFAGICVVEYHDFVEIILKPEKEDNK